MLEVLSPAWIVFFGLVAALFAIDLLRGSRGSDLRTAVRWSAVWVGAGLMFGLWVWASRGGTAATEYYAAYLLEKSLSIDNIFVFVLIFSELRIPAGQQHRVLLLGVAGALVMRALMIWLGVYLLARFHWVIYPFAALLLIAALRLLFGESTERRLVKEACAACNTWVAWIVPVTPFIQGQRFFLHRGGRWVATPLFVALILIEATDVIFALELNSRGARHHARSLHRLHLKRLRHARPALPLFRAGGFGEARSLPAGRSCRRPVLRCLQDAAFGDDRNPGRPFAGGYRHHRRRVARRILGVPQGDRGERGIGRSGCRQPHFGDLAEHRYDLCHCGGELRQAWMALAREKLDTTVSSAPSC